MIAVLKRLLQFAQTEGLRVSTKATLIYRRTDNLRAGQLLLGQTSQRVRSEQRRVEPDAADPLGDEAGIYRRVVMLRQGCDDR